MIAYENGFCAIKSDCGYLSDFKSRKHRGIRQEWLLLCGYNKGKKGVPS